MASRVCWNCETKAHMTPYGNPLGHQERGFGGVPNYVLMGVYQCDECRRMSVAMRKVSGNLNVRDIPELLEQDPQWLPAVGVRRDFIDVPQDIAAAASEAYECESIQAHRAAVLMARSVIEATAKAKGFTTGKLFQKIEALHDAGSIREHIRDAAHEVRHLGNDMAHGDFVEPVTSEEAEEVLQLMSEVLDEVFQSPARVQRRRAARLAKAEPKPSAQG